MFSPQTSAFHAFSLVKNCATRAAESLFAILFPSDCRICETPLVNISRLPVCPRCLDEMIPLRGKTCSICGERVLSMHAFYGAGALLCPLCSRVAPTFARAVAYGGYEGALRELIHLLKYGGVRPAANILGARLADAIAVLEESWRQTDLPQLRLSQISSATDEILIIPVPLHKTRLRQRGFNQADLIARAALRSRENARRKSCGDNLSPVYVLRNDILHRKRETESQIGLTNHQRRVNLRGAFAVTHAEEIAGCEVLLVDDVYTTGATASECARVLRRAGAGKVWVATVARTMKISSSFISSDSISSNSINNYSDQDSGSYDSADKSDDLISERMGDAHDG